MQTPVSDPILTESVRVTRVTDGKKVQVRWAQIEVIGKTKEPGMLWGTWYKVACRFLASGETFTQPLSYDKWVQAKVGVRAYVLIENEGDGWFLATDEYWNAPSSPARRTA